MKANLKAIVASNFKCLQRTSQMYLYDENARYRLPFTFNSLSDNM